MAKAKATASSLQELQHKIDALSLRERVLVLLGGLAVIIALWLLLAQNSIDQRRDNLLTQLQSVDRERSAQMAQLAALSGDTSADAERARQQQLSQLTRRVDELDQKLATLSQGLVSADLLPKILEDVLVTTSQLNLVQLRTLPVEALPLKGTAARNGEMETGVFKHTVALRVSGSYFQVVDFLRALETLPWRFYWERLDYSVERYPRAGIEIRVYTLSAEEGLLGV
jgi:MSHA biogenesis protein MshJ